MTWARSDGRPNESSTPIGSAACSTSRSDQAVSSITYHYNENIQAYEKLLAGRYVLTTSLDPTQATTAETVAAYRQLQTIETRFRVLKDCEASGWSSTALVRGKQPPAGQMAQDGAGRFTSDRGRRLSSFPASGTQSSSTMVPVAVLSAAMTAPSAPVISTNSVSSPSRMRSFFTLAPIVAHVKPARIVTSMPPGQ